MKRINKKRKCKNKKILRRSNIEILVNDPKREKAQNQNRKIVIKKTEAISISAQKIRKHKERDFEKNKSEGKQKIQ